MNFVRTSSTHKLVIIILLLVVLRVVQITHKYIMLYDLVYEYLSFLLFFFVMPIIPSRYDPYLVDETLRMSYASRRDADAPGC